MALRNGWAGAIGPEKVLNLIPRGGAGWMANEQFACNRWQICVCDRIEAGGHALSLGAIGGRCGHPQLTANRGKHGVCAGILQGRYQGLQQVAKSCVVHGESVTHWLGVRVRYWPAKWRGWRVWMNTPHGERKMGLQTYRRGDSLVGTRCPHEKPNFLWLCRFRWFGRLVLSRNGRLGHKGSHDRCWDAFWHSYRRGADSRPQNEQELEAGRRFDPRDGGDFRGFGRELLA